MLLKEVKDELNKYKEDELKLIICELYKSIPKSQRESKDIDDIIRNIQNYKSTGKTSGSQKQTKSAAELQPEIEQFIEYAYNQYYMGPNRYVHKKDRPKWRFMVKSYIKALEAVPSGSEEGKLASDLLRQLYGVLSYACAYWLFTTDDPFRSIGIEQTEVLNKVIVRILGEGVNDQNIKTALEVTVNSQVDSETSHSHLLAVFISNLRITDAKETAVKQCITMREELYPPVDKPVKKGSNYSNQTYERERKNNIIVELIFRLYCSLCEYEEAINYFHKNHKESDKEIFIYRLLYLLFEYDLNEYWNREYVRAVKTGVKPRKSLQDMYKVLQETGELGDTFYI